MRLRRARLRRRRLPRLTARGPAEFVTNPTDRRDELDVRALPHGARYEIIFTKLDYLQPGESLAIMNDHDPKPLYYQLSAENPGEFSWDHLEQGPDVWRVRIGRVAAASPGAAR